MKEMAPYALFGSLIKKHRERAGIAKNALAKQLGVSASLMTRCEEGSRRLSQEKIELFSKKQKLKLSQKNELLGAAMYPTRTEDGLNVRHPAVVAIAAQLNEIEAGTKWEAFLTMEAQFIAEISGGLAEIEILRNNREWSITAEKSIAVTAKIETMYSIAKWEILNTRGLYSYHLGQIEDALDFFNQALNISMSIPIEIARDAIVLTHQHLGDIHRLQGNWKDAESSYKLALQEAEALPNRRRSDAITFRKLSENLLFQGRFSEAQEYLSQAIDLIRYSGDTYEEGKTYLAMGWLYDFQENSVEAIKQKKKGMQLAGSDPNDEYNLMKSNLYLGDSYLIGKQLSEAKSYYEQANLLAEKLGSPIDRSLIDLGLGNVARERGETDIAVHHYQRSMEWARPLHTPYRTALANYEWAICLLQEGDFLGAKAKLEAALSRFNSETPYYTILTRVNLVDVFLALQDGQSARNELIEAFSCIETLSWDSDILRAKLWCSKFKVLAKIRNPDAQAITDTLVELLQHAMNCSPMLKNDVNLVIANELGRLRQSNRTTFDQIWSGMRKNLTRHDKLKLSVEFFENALMMK